MCKYTTVLEVKLCKNDIQIYFVILHLCVCVCVWIDFIALYEISAVMWNPIIAELVL